LYLYSYCIFVGAGRWVTTKITVREEFCIPTPLSAAGAVAKTRDPLSTAATRTTAGATTTIAGAGAAATTTTDALSAVATTTAATTTRDPL
jgi:hypothetical protein